MIDLTYKFLDNSISSYLINKYPYGLAHGKMGICIFLYNQSRLKQDHYLETLANQILDDITCNLSKIKGIDIENGLAGIALGFLYLTKKGFIIGNLNKILHEFDVAIYKKINQLKNGFEIYTLTQILFYFQKRLTETELKNEDKTLYYNLCMEFLNFIHTTIDSEYLREPYQHSILEYKLPSLLHILGIFLHDKMLSYKTERMLVELTTEIISFLPKSEFNKIALLWGMLSIDNKRTYSLWREYIELLYHHIDINKMLTQELKDQHIFLDNGATGAYWLMKQINKLNTPYHFNIDKTMFDHKIYNSQAWNLMRNNPEYLQQHLGLMHGYTGILMAYK